MINVLLNTLCLVAGYMLVGYLLGVPVAAVLDYYLKSKGNEDISIMGAIMVWPLSLCLLLAGFPLFIRSQLERKHL